MIVVIFWYQDRTFGIRSDRVEMKTSLFSLVPEEQVQDAHGIETADPESVSASVRQHRVLHDVVHQRAIDRPVRRLAIGLVTDMRAE